MSDEKRAAIQQFAKLFGPDEDQVLVELDETADSGKIEVRFSYRSRATGGVCRVAVGFEDNDEQCLRAEEYFLSVDETMARRVVAGVESSILDMAGEGGADGEVSLGER